jgi:hypothetical protein
VTPSLDDLRPHLGELVPVVRRAVALDAKSLVRLRAAQGSLSVYATLPFKVLVSRTVTAGTAPDGAPLADLDRTVGGTELLAWFDEENAAAPPARDAEWRGALPPQRGWRRLDRVPDDVVRPLIRSGALALKEAAAREGVPGAQPRAEVADVLLDTVVLTVTDEAGHSAPIQLRTVSSLVRMGFVPRGSLISVDTAGRWTRVSGDYGAAYAESGGLALDLGSTGSRRI